MALLRPMPSEPMRTPSSNYINANERERERENERERTRERINQFIHPVSLRVWFVAYGRLGGTRGCIGIATINIVPR